MKTSTYIVRDGLIERGEGTIRLCDPSGRSQYIPIQNLESLQIAGTAAISAGAACLLAREGIPVVWLNWRNQESALLQTLLDRPNGDVIVAQVRHHVSPRLRVALAMEMLRGAAHGMRIVLRYHKSRGEPVDPDAIPLEPAGGTIDELLGWEGNNRRAYYAQLDKLLPHGMQLDGREYRPPSNETNALLGFLNSLTYTACHIAIADAGLCPSISFLHSIAGRRNSLALDLSEIFKPLLADRVLLTLVRQKTITPSSFIDLRLTPEARIKVLEAWDSRLNETHAHRRLPRRVSWAETIKMEARKMAKHFIGAEEYVAFRANQ